MNTRELYRWIEDQIADFGDKGIGWNTLVSFGKSVIGIDSAKLDCAIGNLINSRRIVVRNNKLTVR